MDQYDVFLSHNSQDKPAVEWLAAKLEDQAGLTVFLDKWNLVPGDPWQEDLENALAASTTVAAFLGPAGISGWHNEELRSALTTRVGDRTRRVIPVLLPGTTMPEDDEIPAFLQRLTWVDFRAGLDDEIAFQRLVAGVKGAAPGRPGKPGARRSPPRPAAVPAKSSPPTRAEQKIHTGGGAYIGGNVNTGGGDFVAGNKTTHVEQGGIAINGPVTGSTIQPIGGSAPALQEQYIGQIYAAIDAWPADDPLDKDDLRTYVEGIRAEDAKEGEAEARLISRFLRNIQRINPQILDLILSIMINPLAGFGAVSSAVAETMRQPGE